MRWLELLSLYLLHDALGRMWLEQSLRNRVQQLGGLRGFTR